MIPGVPFLRGDANGDGRCDISDPIFELDFLFRGGAAGNCEDAADSNDDGTVDISDAVTLLNHRFHGTAGARSLPGAGDRPDAGRAGLRRMTNICLAVTT